jgi:hypothetical protein
MAIPDGTPLGELANAMQLQPPSNATGWISYELVPERARSAEASFWRERPISAWYPATTKTTPAALCSRISKELARSGHPATDEIARAFLGLVCIRRSPSANALEVLNGLLSSINEVEFSDYLIAAFPAHHDFGDFEIDGFHVGRLQRDKLVYICDRVGCDYFKRYPDEFRNRFAVERRGVKDVALRTHDILKWCRGSNSIESIEYKLIDNYFEQLAEVRLDDFKREFMESQFVPIAAGAVAIDVTDANFWFRASFVCVVTWRAERLGGYFCPLGVGVNVDFASADKLFKKTLDNLKSSYEFECLGSSEIHKLIKTFCRFVTLAVLRRKSGSNAPEAFLHYVIALDLVFGERDASNQSIARRVAVVSASQLNLSIQSVLDRMKELYDIRSRYVHSGKSMPDEALDEVIPLVGAVFSCLMRLQRRPHAHDSGFVSRWLKQLDFLYASYNAGKTVSAEELDSAGIAPELS